MAEISPGLQAQLAEFQSSQQQLQFLMSQKAQTDMLLKETDRTLDALGKLPESEKVYKAVGRILILSEKAKVSNELSESKETLGVRLKTFERQEAKLKEKLSGMQKVLESELKPHEGG